MKVKPNLTVGYVMGVGDEVPQALEQLGARVELLDADDLAWGDLNRFDVIMTGVRAYERRADLRAHNQRLIDYARAGGTVIVNYNKFEFNEAQYGPYPGKGRPRARDRRERRSAVLQPQHPVFTRPTSIADADWMGWVQERGLYFLDTDGRDPQMVDLLELDDPFPYNKGAKRGALVEAKVGQGRWIYVGLGLWRQLPAGTDGAYRLMANLISLGNAPTAGGAAVTDPPPLASGPNRLNDRVPVRSADREAATVRRALTRRAVARRYTRADAITVSSSDRRRRSAVYSTVPVGATMHRPSREGDGRHAQG